jgi:hypothetical protein
MMDQTEETVKIYTLEKEDEVLIPLIKEAFKKEEIPLQIRSKYDTAYDGIFIGQKGLADLYVFEKDEQRSIALLTEIKESHQSEDLD